MERACLNCERHGVIAYHRHRECVPQFQANWVLHCCPCVRKDGVHPTTGADGKAIYLQAYLHIEGSQTRCSK